MFWLSAAQFSLDPVALHSCHLLTCLLLHFLSKPEEQSSPEQAGVLEWACSAGHQLSDGTPSHTTAADAGWTDSAAASRTLHHRQMTVRNLQCTDSHVVSNQTKDSKFHVWSGKATHAVEIGKINRVQVKNLGLLAIITGAAWGGILERWCCKHMTSGVLNCTPFVKHGRVWM